MKHRFFRKINPRLITVAIILITAFIIHSCRKENSSKTQAVSSDIMVGLAKQWYNAKYPATTGNGKLVTQSLGGVGTQDWSKTFSPYWDKANTFLIDSLTFIELPALKKGNIAMALNSKVNPAQFNFNTSGSLTSLIIVNKSGNFYIYAMTILADSGYVKGNYNKVKNNTYRYRDKDFTGMVYYDRLDGSFVNGWQYTNGVITAAISPAAPGTPVTRVVQSANSKKNIDLAQVIDCQTTTTTIYWEQCSYYTNDVNDAHPFNCFNYTTSSSNTVCSTINSPGGSTGGSPATPPQQPCTPPADSSSSPSVQTARTIIDVAAPPGTNGSTSGGIVDQTNQIGTTPCVKQTVVVDTIKKTPCQLLKHIDSLAQNATASKANTLIYNEIGTGYEYATDVNLTTFPPNGSYIITPLITNTNHTSVTPAFTWNSKDGYTIVISHDHPFGDGPSPADIFRLYVNSNNANLDNAGVAAVNYYENNAAITTVTKTTTYTITGTDYAKLGALYQQYKADTGAFNSNYRVLTTDFAGAWDQALITIFGNSINLYESYYNKPTFNLIQIVNGKITQINCP
jgi:hypothetical protein